MERWLRGKWEREPCPSPALARFSHFFLHLLTDWTTFHHYLGSLEQDTICTVSSIYWKTAAKAWNWYQISVCNISSGKTGLPFQVFRCSRKFSVGKTHKVVFHAFTFRPDFPEHFCKWWLLTIYKYFRPPRSLILPPPPTPVPDSLGRKLFLLSHRSF